MWTRSITEKVDVAMSASDDNTSANQRRFDSLFEANHPDIYRYCVRRLGPADAEDAAAEVFAVAWRRITEMPAGDACRAWLFGVAYRVVGNKYRHRQRQRNSSQRLRLVRPTETSQPSDGIPGDEIDCLYRALDRLGATDRELLRLASWDDLTRAEIAAVLHINENAVDQRLHRARIRLRTHYDKLRLAQSHPTPEEASA